MEQSGIVGKKEEKLVRNRSGVKFVIFVLLPISTMENQPFTDRIIQKTGLLTRREMQDQVLDNMDLERERGITIKAQAVRTVYKAADGEELHFKHD